MSQIAFVTGANRGIGLELAKILVERGYTTFVAARSIMSAEKSIAEQFSNKSLALPIQLDVTNDEEIQKVVEKVEKTFGKLDILVNNAGVPFPAGENPTFRSVFNEVYNINVSSVAVLSEAFVPLLGKSSRKQGGLILNISSSRGSLDFAFRPDSMPPRVNAYNCSKAGLNMLTILQGRLLKEQNIKTLSVCPGFTATGFNKHTGARSAAESADLCLQLVDDDKSFETGSFWVTPSGKPVERGLW
ncbi:hypothetical protein BGW37DRAFT_419837 [Umbelopsis sp. PMI_123]|nr:hypothetical protein BGW37DRAFT_419837 [Umbelopsis sp. PMI_123]